MSWQPYVVYGPYPVHVLGINEGIDGKDKPVRWHWFGPFKNVLQAKAWAEVNCPKVEDRGWSISEHYGPPGPDIRPTDKLEYTWSN